MLSCVRWFLPLWHWYPPCFMGQCFANIVLVHHHVHIQHRGLSKSRCFVPCNTPFQSNQPAQGASERKPRAVPGQHQVLQEWPGSPALSQQNTNFLTCSRLICKFALHVHNSPSGFLGELQKSWKKSHSLLSSKRMRVSVHPTKHSSAE